MLARQAGLLGASLRGWPVLTYIWGFSMGDSPYCNTLSSTYQPSIPRQRHISRISDTTYAVNSIVNVGNVCQTVRFPIGKKRTELLKLSRWQECQLPYIFDPCHLCCQLN